MIILAFIDVFFVRKWLDELNLSRMHANRNDVAHYAGKKINSSFLFVLHSCAAGLHGEANNKAHIWTHWWLSCLKMLCERKTSDPAASHVYIQGII